MRTFQVLPGARGLDLPDGRSFMADRRGRVLVDDAVGAQIDRSAAYRRYDALIPLAPGRWFPSRDSFVCACGFTPWPWQKSCPRCGNEWSEA